MPKKIEVYKFEELPLNVQDEMVQKAINEERFLDSYYEFDVPFVKEMAEKAAEAEGFFTVDSDGIIYRACQEEWYITGSFALDKMHDFFITHGFTEDEYNFLLDEITYVEVIPYYSTYSISYNLEPDISRELESKFEDVLTNWIEGKREYVNNLDESMRSVYYDDAHIYNCLAITECDNYFTVDGVCVGSID